MTIITGAGRGIGAATAIKLAEGSASDGPPHQVIINYVRDQASAERVAERVRASGAEASTVRADIGTEAGVLELFAAADRIGTVVALVNNAGIVGTIGRFEDLEAEHLHRMWAVNISSAFLCSREAVRRMSTRHGGAGGVIVNVSSRAATFGSPHEYIDYAASKGAVDTMTMGLATEVAAEGIRVNAVRPGLIETDIHADAGRADRVAQLAHRIPMQRGGTADEVASLIVWLLSPAASYVTGALIDIGGGR